MKKRDAPAVETDREYILLTEWCRINGFGLSNVYEKIARAELTVHYPNGRRPYLTRKDRADFAKFVEGIKAPDNLRGIAKKNRDGKRDGISPKPKTSPTNTGSS